MALLKIHCPECNCRLKSPTGFTVGDTVSCPKCETDFIVRQPEEGDEDEPRKGTLATKGRQTEALGKKPVRASVGDDEDGGDEEDERPKKKKKKRAYDEDDEPVRSYRNSPLRYAILGVLVVTMLVMGYFLIRKWKDEREMAAGGNGPVDDVDKPVLPVARNPNGPPLGPGRPIAKFPVQNPPNLKQPNPKQPGANSGGGLASNPLGDILGGGSVPPGEVPARTQKLKAALIGTWVADLGEGVAEELTYNANGTYTAKLTGTAPATASGTYTVLQLVGTRGLRIQLDGSPRPLTITVNFEGDEIEHPSLQKGVTGTFRKK